VPSKRRDGGVIATGRPRDKALRKMRGSGEEGVRQAGAIRLIFIKMFAHRCAIEAACRIFPILPVRVARGQ
jgi:hypothetical protein